MAVQAIVASVARRAHAGSLLDGRLRERPWQRLGGADDGRRRSIVGNPHRKVRRRRLVARAGFGGAGSPAPTKFYGASTRGNCAAAWAAADAAPLDPLRTSRGRFSTAFEQAASSLVPDGGFSRASRSGHAVGVRSGHARRRASRVTRLLDCVDPGGACAQFHELNATRLSPGWRKPRCDRPVAASGA